MSAPVLKQNERPPTRHGHSLFLEIEQCRRGPVEGRKISVLSDCRHWIGSSRNYSNDTRTAQSNNPHTGGKKETQAEFGQIF